MKNTILLLLVSIFSIAAMAQKPIVVEVVNRPMSKGDQPAFYVNIHEGNLKEVIKGWEDLVEEDTKAKVEKGDNDEYFIYNAGIERLTTDSLDAYAYFIETTEGIQVYSYFAIEGQFVADKHEKSLTVKKILHDYAAEQYRIKVREVLKDEEKDLKELEGDLEKLVKQNEKSHKQISENKREISELRESIEISKSDQNRKQTQIEAQKDIVLKRETKEEKEAAEDVLKDLQNEKKKLNKKEEKMFEDIDDLEAEIREEERNIKTNVKDQELKRTEIADQKAVVNGLQDKLENIE